MAINIESVHHFHPAWWRLKHSVRTWAWLFWSQSWYIAENSLFCLNNNCSTWNQLSVHIGKINICYPISVIGISVTFSHYYCGCSKRNTHKKFHSVISHVLL